MLGNRPQGDSNPCQTGDVDGVQVAAPASVTEPPDDATPGVWRESWRETFANHPELAGIVDRWATLPELIRSAIVATANAVRS